MAVRKKVLKNNLDHFVIDNQPTLQRPSGIPESRFYAFELPSIILGERVYPGNKSNGFIVKYDE